MMFFIVEILLGSSFHVGTVPPDVTYFTATKTLKVREISFLTLGVMRRLRWRSFVSSFSEMWSSFPFPSIGS